jgi:hypothetical protein
MRLGYSGKAKQALQAHMSTENPYWFRAKRSGLGWGLPCSWQGWVFFTAWLTGLLVAAVVLMPRRPFTFTLVLAAMTLILVVICYFKGEPLSRD